MRIVDMVGFRSGKLQVVARRGSRRGEACWLCACDCGGQVKVVGSHLRKGTTRSCGCLNLAITADGVARILNKYKKGAMRRSLSFDLSPERFAQLLTMDCDYCGEAPSQTIRVGHNLSKIHPVFKYNGIDRVDASKGYVEGNVVPCCGICNRAKGQMSRADFLLWILKIRAAGTRGQQSDFAVLMGDGQQVRSQTSCASC